MSYEQAMNWHKKHPKGIPNLYFGFDSCRSTRKTKQELRDFYPKYVAYHKAKSGYGYKILSLDEYVASRLNH